jgi:hypothetical protein
VTIISYRASLDGSLIRKQINDLLIIIKPESPQNAGVTISVQNRPQSSGSAKGVEN